MSRLPCPLVVCLFGVALPTLAGCAARSAEGPSASSPKTSSTPGVDPCGLGEFAQEYSGDDLVHTRATERHVDPPAPAPALLASSIRRELITDVINSHQGALQACYREGLARDPELRGTITVSWAIIDGEVDDVELDRVTLADGCLIQCVLDEAATWSFPAFRGYPETLWIHYPFHFNLSE